MKVKDITEEWDEAERTCDRSYLDTPEDHIGWKDIRSFGYDAIMIRGIVWSYSKHGLLEILEED